MSRKRKFDRMPTQEPVAKPKVEEKPPHNENMPLCSECGEGEMRAYAKRWCRQAAHAGDRWLIRRERKCTVCGHIVKTTETVHSETEPEI